MAKGTHSKRTKRNKQIKRKALWECKFNNKYIIRITISTYLYKYILKYIYLFRYSKTGTKRYLSPINV